MNKNNSLTAISLKETQAHYSPQPMAKKGVEGKLPRIRFSGFMDTWQFQLLKDLAKRCTQKNTKNHHTRVLTNSAEHGVVDQRDYFDKDIANQNNLAGYFIVDKGDYVYNPRISISAPVALCHPSILFSDL